MSRQPGVGVRGLRRGTSSAGNSNLRGLPSSSTVARAPSNAPQQNSQPAFLGHSRGGFTGMQLEGSNALRAADAAAAAQAPTPPSKSQSQSTKSEPQPKPSSEPLPESSSPSKTAPNENATAARANGTIIIHVCDEARGVNRDFPCARATLLREMRYFRTYLTSPTGEEVDISVHCDVHIFEWLVQYMENPTVPPKLDTASVVSILISSEFLEMDRLVHVCLRFMADRLGEIVKMPIDLNCVSDKLLTKLAELLDAHALSGVVDKRDRFLPKLFKRRLELDFRNPPLDPQRAAGLSKIACCRWCGQLYHCAASPLLACASAPDVVGYRGEVESCHAPQPDWSLTECVSRLHRHGMGWEDIYWLLWGVSHVFYCRATNGHFMASDYCRRRHHPGTLVAAATYADTVTTNSAGAAVSPATTASSLGSAGNSGTMVYSCCGASSSVFRVGSSLAGVGTGCDFTSHVVENARGAVCFIGPVRWFEPGMPTDQTPSHPSNSSSKSNSSNNSPSQKVSPPTSPGWQSSGQLDGATAETTAATSPEGGVKTNSSLSAWDKARGLLQKQAVALQRAVTHPALQQELAALLRVQAAATAAIAAATAAAQFKAPGVASTVSATTLDARRTATNNNESSDKVAPGTSSSVSGGSTRPTSAAKLRSGRGGNNTSSTGANGGSSGSKSSATSGAGSGAGSRAPASRLAEEKVATIGDATAPAAPPVSHAVFKATPLGGEAATPTAMATYGVQNGLAALAALASSSGGGSSSRLSGGNLSGTLSPSRTATTSGGSERAEEAHRRLVAAAAAIALAAAATPHEQAAAAAAATQASKSSSRNLSSNSLSSGLELASPGPLAGGAGAGAGNEAKGYAVVPASAHPLGCLPDDVARDLEVLREKGAALKLEPAKQRAWELDLVQEHDAKRMLLLSRLLHQRRAPQHAYVDPTLENAASGGGRNGGGRNGNGATNGGGRNRKGRGDDDGRRWR